MGIYQTGLLKHATGLHYGNYSTSRQSFLGVGEVRKQSLLLHSEKSLFCQDSDGLFTDAVHKLKCMKINFTTQVYSIHNFLTSQ